MVAALLRGRVPGITRAASGRKHILPPEFPGCAGLLYGERARQPDLAKAFVQVTFGLERAPSTSAAAGLPPARPATWLIDLCRPCPPAR